MEKYKLQNLLNNVKTDLTAYIKAFEEISHLQKKKLEYGFKPTAADDELLDRTSDLIESFVRLKNQLEEMNK